MAHFQEYGMGWLIYGLAVVGLLLVTWRLFGGIKWRYPRRVIFLTVLVLLGTPAIGEGDYWAPAWVIGSLELLFGGIEGLMPVLHIVGMVWLVVFGAYSFLALVYFLVWGQHASRRATQEHSMPDAENTDEERIPPQISS